MRAARRFKLKPLNNSGSALVTVIVSMVFIIALGASLLFAAYASYSIQIAQRGDKANFYSADTVMDEIRLGVQTLLSESIASAYTKVTAERLSLEDANYDPQRAFDDGIIAQLLTKKIADGGTAYFSAGQSGGKTVITGYNITALADFIGAASANATVTGTGTVVCEYEGQNLKAFSLKGVSVKYVDKGFESNITSDITVTMPSFYSSSSVTSAINNYAIIANNGLIHKLGVGSGFVDPSINIDGSVFAGTDGVDLGGNGYALSFTNCNLISKGAIKINDSAVLNFTSLHYELWTDGIFVGNNARVTLDGKVHVADDLEINGSGATVTLKNSYFGFGNSTTLSEKSSSILVNGRNSTLKINELSKLSLAGVSFINVSNVVYQPDGTLFGSALPMGQSMSVKSDQLAYLIPAKCITNYSTNPCVFTTAEDMTPQIDMDAVLWTTDAGAKKLSDYIGSGKGEIKVLYKPFDSGTQIVYVFLSFSDKTYANAYFKDYFETDPSKIEPYLNLYLSLSSRATDAKVNAAGNTYKLDDKGTVVTTDDTLTLEPAGDGVWADGEQLLYNGMNSPYTMFVNTVNTGKITNATLVFKDAADKPVAVVSTEANYTFSGTSADSIQLIISSGSVTIADHFTGIIMAGQNVIANADVTGVPINSGIIDATCTYGGTTYKLSDFINNSAQISGGSTSQANPWNLDTLVYYSNWQKH